MNESALPFTSTVKTAQPEKKKGLSVSIDNVLRRMLDIFVSFFGLLFLAPVFIWIAILIRRDSPGPIFYRGKRTGLNGREFGILKFRTMYEKPTSYNGSPVTAHDDPRITPLGKWLRDTKINELPQLWNVLVGEMSLVGPRPEDPEIVARWPQSLKAELLSVKPGVTSPATVLFRDEETRLKSGTVMDDYLRNIMPSKLRLDTLYINNRNILTDLDVIFWTTVVLLPYLRKLPIPETRLYWGPLALFTSRYLSWFLIDSLMAFLAIGLSGVIWRTSGPLDIGVGPSIWLALGMSFLFSLINSIFGMNEVHWKRAPASDSLALVFSTILTTMIIILLNGRVVARFELPTAMILVSAILALAGFLAARYKERLLTGVASRWLALRNGATAVGERVLIIGAGQNCQMATWFFGQSSLARAFTVIGIVDDDPRKQGLRYDGYRILGTTQDIPAIVKKYDIGIIFFTISNISRENRRLILNICQSTQTIVIILPDVMETLKNRVTIANTTFVDNDDTYIDAQEYDAELSELNELAQAGEWDRLRSRLEELRRANNHANSQTSME